MRQVLSCRCFDSNFSHSQPAVWPIAVFILTESLWLFLAAEWRNCAAVSKHNSLLQYLHCCWCTGLYLLTEVWLTMNKSKAGWEFGTVLTQLMPCPHLQFFKQGFSSCSMNPAESCYGEDVTCLHRSGIRKWPGRNQNQQCWGRGQCIWCLCCLIYCKSNFAFICKHAKTYCTAVGSYGLGGRGSSTNYKIGGSVPCFYSLECPLARCWTLNCCHCVGECAYNHTEVGRLEECYMNAVHLSLFWLCHCTKSHHVHTGASDAQTVLTDQRLCVFSDLNHVFVWT